MNTASYLLFIRSSDQPAAFAAAGSIDSRAVIPAGSKMAPSAARPASSGTLSPVVIARIGMADTDNSESTSEIIDILRRPKKSTAVPEIRVEKTSGRVPAAATIAASAAEPVRCSTSQGIATIDTPLPMAATTDAKSSRSTGRRFT